MAQRVSFMVLPNTMDQILLDRCVTILAHVEREQPDFKTLRTWLREQNVWKKEETPEALDLVGLRGLDGRGAIALAPVARKLLAADTPDARKQALFQHLLEANPILVKYVVEALDAEAGGRLHSTHELYRYITSYAYPGTYVRLIDFQNFVKWMQAADALRIIGIRWGLSDVGKAWLPKIRAVDVEEILEDEALEAEEGDEDDNALGAGDVPVPATPAAHKAPVPAPLSSPVPGPPSATDEDTGEEDFPDMPTEAPLPPIDEDAARRFEEQLGISEAPVLSAAPFVAGSTASAPSSTPAVARDVAASAAAPAGDSDDFPSPVVGFAPARPERSAPAVAGPVLRPLRSPALDGGIAPQDRMETVRKVRAWWEGFPHKRRVRAADLGFEPNAWQSDPRRFLVRLMTAAVLVDHEAPEAPIADFLSRLDGVDAFARVGSTEAGAGLEAVLADLSWFDGNLWYQRLSENLVHTARFRRRLDAASDTLESLSKSRGGKQVAERIHLDLFGGAFYLPPFWVIREMHALGIWDKQAFASVACVPSYRVRLSAFRLGLVDSYYADGFPALLQASQVLSRFFDHACDYDAPLAQLADGFGCLHRCPHVLDCPLACREKYSI